MNDFLLFTTFIFKGIFNFFLVTLNLSLDNFVDDFILKI